MIINEKQLKRLSKLFFLFIAYANDRLFVADDLCDRSGYPDERALYDVAQEVWAGEGHTSLVADYVRDNPDKLSRTDLREVAQWENALAGIFTILSDGRDTLFNIPRYTLVVRGITEEIDTIIDEELPVLASTILLPFENVIIYACAIDTVPIERNEMDRLGSLTDLDAVKEITIAQIFVADTLARLGKQSEATAKKLREIQNALAAGTSFGDVVKQFSEDKNVDDGGMQEPFAPNRRQGDFVKAVLSLQPEQISQPIASQNGWHIVQLVEAKSVSLDDDAMYTLRNRISRDDRSHKSKDSFIARLKKEYNYNESGRAKAMKLFLKNMPPEFFQSKDLKLQKISGIEKMKPMCTYADQEISVQDFAKYFDRFKGARLQPNEFAGFLDERFDSYAQEKMVRYEQGRLEEKYPEFQALVKEFHDGMVLYEINTKKVWAEATTDTVGLEKFYQENKEKYIDPVTAEPSPLNDIRAIVITDYQEYLDQKWIAELRKKYNPTINQKVFDALLKK